MNGDRVAESIKGSVAMALSAVSLLTLNEVVALVTVLYVVLQTAYLTRKWWREEREWSAKSTQLEKGGCANE